MASSSISKMEISQDKQVDDVRKIARDLCKKVKKEVEDNSRTAAERYFIHLLLEEKVEEELQRQNDELKKQFLMLLNANRKRKAKRKGHDIEKMMKEERFWKLLRSSEKKVKFIDALFDSEELKYDSPPGTIAEIAKQLLAIHPLESEEIAIQLAKDRVRSLDKMHDAERNYEVQNWLRTFPFITAKEKYMKHILDSYNLITERHKKKPYYNEKGILNLAARYYNEKGILNLAARMVHEGYEIKDVSEEILKLQKMGCRL